MDISKSWDYWSLFYPQEQKYLFVRVSETNELAVILSTDKEDNTEE